MSSSTFDDDYGSSSDGSEFLDLEYNVDGTIVSYTCTQLVENNPTTRSPIDISFFYDLMYPNTEDSEDVKQTFEFLLLQHIAAGYDLQSGRSCLSPPEDSFFHMIKVSSLPEDVPNKMLNSCLLLYPNLNQTCTSYSGAISGYILGPDETIELVGFIADSINDGTVTSGTSLQAKFLGTEIEVRNDKLPDPIRAQMDSVVQAREDRNITVVGGLLASALAVSMIGFIFTIYKLRHKRRMEWSSRGEHVIMATKSEDQNGGGGRRRYRRTLDDINQLQNQGEQERHAQPNQQIFDLDCLPSNFVGKYGAVEQETTTQQPYKFELGDNMKSSLFEIHGNIVLPHHADDISESDIDSWAQTDATLGSLDGRITDVAAEI